MNTTENPGEFINRINAANDARARKSMRILKSGVDTTGEHMMMDGNHYLEMHDWHDDGLGWVKVDQMICSFLLEGHDKPCPATV